VIRYAFFSMASSATISSRKILQVCIF
jgi:hypothetical protein